MKVGIVGNYGNNNKGDEAILEGIIQQLEEGLQLSRADITVFSNQEEQMKETFGVHARKLYYKKGGRMGTFLNTMRENKQAVQSLDLLIIGGGGIFMDLYGTESFLFGLYGYLAKKAGTPAVLYGVGAGPIKTKIGAFILKQLAHSVKLVTVRDPESKALMESIGINRDIHIIGDPAFKLPVNNDTHSFHPSIKKIAITAVPYYHGSYWPTENLAKYHDYVEGMAKNIDALLKQDPTLEINFFSTKQPQDTDVTKDIASRLTDPSLVTVYEDTFDAKEMASFTHQHDLVIGTRLHSLILSLVSETPMMAVAYHHKVKDFMDMLELSDRVIDIEALSSEPTYFLSVVNNMDKDWSQEQARYKTLSEEMKVKAFSGIELIKEKVL
jgi:polysaccharide pyruvyl transferase CsaB